VVRVATRAEKASSAFRSFDVVDGSAHQLEVRAVGDGDVRVYGLSLDRREHGIVLDALGINGARITTALSWNEQHWAEQLRHRSPSLVVLAYGTNESTDLDVPQHAYERQLVDALGRVARAVPTASCLLLGPARSRDRAERQGQLVDRPKITEIIAAQKRVADAAGCAFYDQLSAMVAKARSPRGQPRTRQRAQKDRVHLTREGYAQLGSSFASDVMRAYAQWRRESGLPRARRATPPYPYPSHRPHSRPASPRPRRTTTDPDCLV